MARRRCRNRVRPFDALVSAGGGPVGTSGARAGESRGMTMRVMVMGKATAATEAGVLPTTEELEAMGAYFEDLVKAGILLAAGGLTASASGARVRFSGNGHTVIDGPFAETKELVAGYSILEVGSMDEA